MNLRVLVIRCEPPMAAAQKGHRPISLASSNIAMTVIGSRTPNNTLRTTLDAMGILWKRAKSLDPGCDGRVTAEPTFDIASPRV